MFRRNRIQAGCSCGSFGTGVRITVYISIRPQCYRAVGSYVSVLGGRSPGVRTKCRIIAIGSLSAHGDAV